MVKQNSQRAASGLQKRGHRASSRRGRSDSARTDDSDQAGSLESVWIDAEEVWKATEPLSARVPAASPASLARRSTDLRRSGSLVAMPPVQAADDPRTPSAQLLSQQPQQHRLGEHGGSGEKTVRSTGVVTALFANDATVAAKPARARTSMGSPAGHPPAAAVHSPVLTEGTDSRDREGALTSSSARSSSGSHRHQRRGSSSAVWSPHDATVRAMLDADPPTATRIVQLQEGFTVPSPQTPLWSQLAFEEDDEGSAEVDATPTAAFALADPSIALVSGDSAIYPQPRSQNVAGAHEDAYDALDENAHALTHLSLTQEALALEAEVNQPFSQPLQRRRRRRERSAPRQPSAEAVEWTITRPEREEAETHVAVAAPSGPTRARPAKRSRSSMALVSVSERPSWGAGLFTASSPRTVEAARSQSAVSAATVESDGTRAAGSSSQRRLQAWAAQQRQFFRFIDSRPMLTVSRAEITPPKSRASAATRASPRAAATAGAATPTPAHRHRSPHGVGTRKSLSLVAEARREERGTTAAKKAPLLLASRFSERARHASGSLEVAAPSPRAGSLQFAQFVANVKKRGAAAATPTPSSTPHMRAAH